MPSGSFWSKHSTSEQAFQPTRPNTTSQYSALTSRHPPAHIPMERRALDKLTSTPGLAPSAPVDAEQKPESFYQNYHPYGYDRRPSEISDTDALRGRRPPPINIQVPDNAIEQGQYGGHSTSQLSSPTAPEPPKKSLRDRLKLHSSKHNDSEGDGGGNKLVSRRKSLRKKDQQASPDPQKSETDLSDTTTSPPPSRQWQQEPAQRHGSEQDFPNFGYTGPQAVGDPYVTYSAHALNTPVSADSQTHQHLTPQDGVLAPPPGIQYQAYQRPAVVQGRSIAPYVQGATPRQSLELQPQPQFSRPSSRQSYDSQGSTGRFPLHDDGIQRSGPPSREGSFPISSPPAQLSAAEHMPPPPPPHKRMEPSKLGAQQPQQQPPPPQQHPQQGPVRDIPTPAIVRNQSSMTTDSSQMHDAERPLPQAYQKGQQMQSEGDIQRGSSPPPTDGGDADFQKLLKDYRELRDKYSKVKRHYWERDDQVKQLQNTLAHQRLSQTRTSLDDGEYCARLTRLSGLVGQLAFTLRKDWKMVPGWLQPCVNVDALATGKQEMTAVGKAYVSRWLVEEVFDRYFHPALHFALSEDLKSLQKNLRNFSPPSQSIEEEEALISKIINWRLTTIDGLQPMLSSAEAGKNRAELVDHLNKKLVAELQHHMNDPPPNGLEGGVNMIIELVVGILGNLPFESRDVHIEYFPPGFQINHDLMTVETGIPSLGGGPEAAAVAEGAGGGVAPNDKPGNMEGNADAPKDSTIREASPSRGEKKSLFSGLMSSKKAAPSPQAQQQQQLPTSAAPGKHDSATTSQTSLQQPGNGSDDANARVRMCVFLGMRNRSKNIVLYKAPVHVM